MRQAFAGFFCLACAPAFAQAPAPASLTFEVASVKPSAPIAPNARVYFGPVQGGPGTPDPERITWTYARFLDLLMAAYDVKAYQISGPAWFNTERYDVAANVPPRATKEQVSVMWQNLLAERFGVKLHHEPREFQVEELVLAKGGPRFNESAVDPAVPVPFGPPKMDRNGALAGPGLVVTIRMNGNGPSARAVAIAQPLSKLTAMLGNQINRPVLDKTGLTGLYDFDLEFTPNVPPPGPGPSVPGDASTPGTDIAEAVQQQLGLRLVANKATLDVVVVDKAERVPTAN